MFIILGQEITFEYIFRRVESLRQELEKLTGDDLRESCPVLPLEHPEKQEKLFLESI